MHSLHNIKSPRAFAEKSPGRSEMPLKRSSRRTVFWFVYASSIFQLVRIGQHSSDSLNFQCPHSTIFFWEDMMPGGDVANETRIKHTARHNRVKGWLSCRGMTIAYSETAKHELQYSPFASQDGKYKLYIYIYCDIMYSIGISITDLVDECWWPLYMRSHRHFGSSTFKEVTTVTAPQGQTGLRRWNYRLPQHGQQVGTSHLLQNLHEFAFTTQSCTSWRRGFDFFLFLILRPNIRGFDLAWPEVQRSWWSQEDGWQFGTHLGTQGLQPKITIWNSVSDV